MTDPQLTPTIYTEICSLSIQLYWAPKRQINKTISYTTAKKEKNAKE